MSYIDRKQDPRRRANAIIAVGVIHAGLAYVVVTGLGAKIAERLTAPPLVGEQIKLPPPPPKPDPTPPQPKDRTDTHVDAPTPPFPFPPPPDPGPQAGDDTAGPTGGVDPGPPLPPLPPPPPSPSFTPRHAVPRGGTAGWISTDDYPRQPLVNGIEGSVGYRLVIGTNGRVASCELTRPSGNRALDDATCRLITGRARFEAATDEAGAKVLGTFAGSVRWEIPE